MKKPVATPPFRHLVLDFDGTLFDTAPDILDCVARAARSLGFEPEIPLTVDLIGPPLPGLVAKILPRLDETARRQVIEAFKTHYDGSDYPLTKTYDGIEALFARAQATGVGLSIATNKRLRPTLRILERFPLGDFRFIYAHDMEAGRIFKKAELLARILAELALPPHEVLMVGDTLADIEAARAVGMPVAAVTYGYASREYLASLSPDYLFDSARELLRLLPVDPS